MLLTPVFTTGLATAWTLDEPHVGGLGYSGPTTADLAAVYWNPAVLALMTGGHVTLSLGSHHDSFRVSRAPITPGGEPGGMRSFPDVTGTGGTRALTWPPGPGSFLAFGYNFLGRFTLAVAAFEPFAERVSFAAPGGQQPTRYHRISADLRNFALVPTLALRISNELRVGVAPGFLFSAGRMTFDQDTALNDGSEGATTACPGGNCQVEDPQLAARYRLRSGLSPFDSPPAFTIGGGIYFRRGNWAAGLGYSSRPLGKQGGGVTVDADGSGVDGPAGRSVCGTTSPADQPQDCVSAQIAYRLPDVFTAGVSYQITPNVEVTAYGRLLTWSVHDRINVRLAGPASPGLGSAQGLPDRIVLYRGFHNSFDGRLRGSVVVWDRWRFGAQLRVQTSAVPSSAVSPAAIDGTTFEPALLASARVWHLTFSAGYAFAFMLPVTVSRSDFDPGSALACNQAGGDLALGACGARLVGADRPTAAGRYRAHGHTASLTTTFTF